MYKPKFFHCDDVPRQTDEVDQHVPADGPRQVGEKEAGSFEDADQVQRSVGIVGIDLLSHFLNTLLNLLRRQQQAK